MVENETRPTADICLLLEGTYPYVSGGVSTWVHQIINAYPDWKFAIFYIGGQPDPKAEYRYQIPANVVQIEELYLFDAATATRGSNTPLPANWSVFRTALRKLLVRLPDGSRNDLDMLLPLVKHISKDESVSFDQFWHDRETWAVLHEVYTRYAADDSFLHFFWACRYLVEPLWKLGKSINRIPEAKIYHTACTGYAGFVGAVISRLTGRPLLLTEHGIYLKERITDIYRSAWIPEFPPQRPLLTEPLGSLRRMWIGFFDVLGRLCYHSSADIVSLFGKNARVQEHFGAESDKITIIPNGIATEPCEVLYEARRQRQAENPQSCVVGFLGRVVSIKDVKTLLRSARLVCDQLPHARFIIAGPTAEEPEYYQDCLDLTEQLGLNSNVEFLGLRKRDDVLPLMDVMVLTSISEGLPFVALESFATGVPIVSTDVGACRELIEGRADETPALGAAGLVTEIGNTDQIARALIQILTDQKLQTQMSEAGRSRARDHYHERHILASYRQLYQKLIDSPSRKATRETAVGMSRQQPASA